MSQEHLDARRAEILEGARRAFSRYGYEGATVAKLEQETGLSRGAIFHYFESKLDLFVALATSDNLGYQAVMIEDGVDAVFQAIAAADPEWLRVLIETEAKLLHDEEFQRRISTPAEQQAALLDSFARAQADGRMRDDIGATDLVRFTTMVVNGLALRVAVGDPTDVGTVLTLVNDALRPRD